MSDRRTSVTFSTPPNRDRASSYTPQRDRSASLTVPKRDHSLSVSSVDLAMSEYFEDNNQDNNQAKGKIYLDDIDLEKQLIITAGGNKDTVMCFLAKLFFLTFVVLGSCVLVFYAL